MAICTSTIYAIGDYEFAQSIMHRHDEQLNGSFLRGERTRLLLGQHMWWNNKSSRNSIVENKNYDTWVVKKCRTVSSQSWSMKKKPNFKNFNKLCYCNEFPWIEGCMREVRYFRPKSRSLSSAIDRKIPKWPSHGRVRCFYKLKRSRTREWTMRPLESSFTRTYTCFYIISMC